MKSDMCFPSTEEFSLPVRLCCSAMLPSWSSPGRDLIAAVTMVQPGYYAVASPCWSGGAHAIVRHAFRITRRDSSSRTLMAPMRNVQLRTRVTASMGSSCLRSDVCQVRLSGSVRSVFPSSAQALLRGFSVALRLGGHLLPRALRVSVSQNKSSAQDALPPGRRFLLGPAEKADLGLGSRAHSHGCARSALSRSGQKRRALCQPIETTSPSKAFSDETPSFTSTRIRRPSPSSRWPQRARTGTGSRVNLCRTPNGTASSPTAGLRSLPSHSSRVLTWKFRAACKATGTRTTPEYSAVCGKYVPLRLLTLSAPATTGRVSTHLQPRKTFRDRDGARKGHPWFRVGKPRYACE